MMTEKGPPTHITFLLPNLEGGGAERVIVQLANSFSILGLSVDLLLLQKTGILLSQVSRDVQIIDMGISNMYLCLPGLISYLKRKNPEVLLSTLEFTSLVALLARRISGMKTRIVVRVSVAISKRKRTMIKKIIEHRLVALMYPWADRLVTVSRGTMQDLLEFVHLPADRIHTIYNPVITEELQDQANDAITHPYYQEGQPPVILGVGRLTEQKDFNTLIRAFNLLRIHASARLLILGEGRERTNLENLVHSLGLDGDVDLPGYAVNPFAYMQRSAVFVLSSRWEGLPNVLIQALACGCPVVSTNCITGPAEIVDGGNYGHLTPVGDPDAMAQAILQVLHGDRRIPPTSWLDQFHVGPVVRQYLHITGLEEFLDQPIRMINSI